jgi:predicted RNA-binding Zn ribbon-like protein
MTKTHLTSALLEHPSADQEWAATARYDLRPAPDGLALVQDFLNTRAKGLTEPDLLGDADLANNWSRTAIDSWSERRGITSHAPTMNSQDAAMLRDLRDEIDRTITGPPTENAHTLVAAAEFTVSGSGESSWLPTGQGWQWFHSAIAGEILLSQHTDRWQRIKQCRNNTCRATIYDSSWNYSAVWHNRTVCDPSYVNRGVQTY